MGLTATPFDPLYVDAVMACHDCGMGGAASPRRHLLLLCWPSGLTLPLPPPRSLRVLEPNEVGVYIRKSGCPALPHCPAAD